MAYHLITENLYLGDRSAANNADLLNKLGFILTVEVDPLSLDRPHNIRQMHIALEDVPEADLVSELGRGVEFISEGVEREGQPTLVHCRAGMSRSASVVIAYLMKSRSLTLSQAFDFVKSHRQCVRPNEGFWEQLKLYQTSLGHCQG